MSAGILNGSDAFPVAVKRGRAWSYHPRLVAIRGLQVSGVYALIGPRKSATGLDVLYVGESHTGRLYDTITRHFRAWSIDPRRDATGRRRGGVTYDRGRVLVVFSELPADIAQAAQYAEIQRLGPLDNVPDGHTVAAELPT